MTKKSLMDFMDKAQIKRTLRSFSLTTGLSASYVSPDGTEITDDESNFAKCSFCKIIRDSKEGAHRCAVSAADSGNMSYHIKDMYISRCHAGLVRITSSIVYKSQYLGCIICGPVLLWDWDEIALQEFTSRTQDLMINKDALLVASKNIRVVSSHTISASAEILQIVVKYILDECKKTEQGAVGGMEREQIAEQILEKDERTRLLESLETYNNQMGNYPLHKEKELVSLVQMGDRTGAKEILNDMLGDIFFKNNGNSEILKVRILELLVILSRAAVEGGASLHTLLGSNFYFIQLLLNLDDFDQACLYLAKVLDYFLDLVYESRNVKNAKCISEAFKYIRAHHDEDITLDSVAKAVHISPFYLSHMLKEEAGITFVEYLTKIRVEEAKWLLRSTDLSIVEIGIRIGYSDPGYFSKVFKKATGMTPNAYRKGL